MSASQDVQASEWPFASFFCLFKLHHIKQFPICYFAFELNRLPLICDLVNTEIATVMYSCFSSNLRMQCLCTLQPWSKSRLRAEDVMLFPWEVRTDEKSSPGKVDREEVLSRYRAAKAKVGLVWWGCFWQDPHGMLFVPFYCIYYWYKSILRYKYKESRW